MRDKLTFLLTFCSYLGLGWFVFLREPILILFIVFCTLSMIFGRGKLKAYGEAVMLNIDELGAAILHRTAHRTISGITGERVTRGKIGAFTMQKFINWLFSDNTHCQKRFVKEIKYIEAMEKINNGNN